MLYYFALRQKIMLTEFLNRPLSEPQQRHLNPQDPKGYYQSYAYCFGLRDNRRLQAMSVVEVTYLGDHPEQPVIRNAAFQELLSRIPAKSAQAFILHYLEGYSIQDVALQVRTTPSGVKQVIGTRLWACRRKCGALPGDQTRLATSSTSMDRLGWWKRQKRCSRKSKITAIRRGFTKSLGKSRTKLRLRKLRIPLSPKSNYKGDPRTEWKKLCAG